jgi:hypothetical protein
MIETKIEYCREHVRGASENYKDFLIKKNTAWFTKSFFCFKWITSLEVE